MFSIVIDVNGLSSNANSPIDVTLFGITTDVNELLENASSPIDVTLFGITTDVNELLENADPPIDVTGYPCISLGITTSVGARVITTLDNHAIA